MFDSLIPDARSFLDQLTRNNTRDWFRDHKAHYDATLRAPALGLLEVLTPQLEALTGCTVIPKLFRPHRDLRFSKDKTPYKTHLHMMWTISTGTRQDPAFFFGIERTGVTVATGMMGFKTSVLADWRRVVDLDGDHIASTLKSVTDKGYRLWEPELKRVPSPFDKAHLHGDLLRQKRVIVAGQPDLSSPLDAGLMAAFGDLWPVSDMLVGIAEVRAL